ncbi:uncharacterized protein LOC115719211 [Cannabis sativa]|uniref:uncharacterized protein LOC115719211 n=1 Tax=Cannabis sativa TaxID=3483 RepID=UPI0029C9F0BB|nr:uncharacterized protein LOC115719211 [Cannabis sativa]
MLKEINTTTITLIPKTTCPKSVTDFRYIAHNVLVCQDLVRLYGRKNCKSSCMIIIDLRKAYDTIEWEFLEEMLIGYGFPDQFIQLIMCCIRTPKFSLLFNGSMCGFFNAKRGLRQGDHMSPLLFVLGMEYFSRIFQKIGNWPGFKFQDRCSTLKLNRMCFANDKLIFNNGDFISIMLLRKGLKLFSSTSGLMPNEQKTAIYCSGMPEPEVVRILEASNFTRSSLPFSKVKMWSSRNLSYMGRVTLGNAGTQDGAGPGFVAWEKICLPKGAGGLGFRNIQEWNVAAMARYVWDIASKKDCLFVKWIHNVYLKDRQWWDYDADCSWYWKKLVGVKNKLKLKTDVASFVLQKYKIQNGYRLLFSNHGKISWCKFVWDRLIIPKYKFILWLVL